MKAPTRLNDERDGSSSSREKNIISTNWNILFSFFSLFIISALHCVSTSSVSRMWRELLELCTEKGNFLHPRVNEKFTFCPFIQQSCNSSFILFWEWLKKTFTMLSFISISVVSCWMELNAGSAITFFVLFCWWHNSAELSPESAYQHRQLSWGDSQTFSPEIRLLMNWKSRPELNYTTDPVVP